MTLAGRLPAFTWDRIAPLREKAHFHPNGPVDLSMGTPVDPVPDVIRGALSEGSNAPGYPATRGTARLRSAAAGWLARAHGVCVSPDDVLPVVGTKEFIAWLPVMLGLGPGDVVVHPELAYPTYDIGARLAPARGVGLALAIVGLAAGIVGLAPAITGRQIRKYPSFVAEFAVQSDRAGA
jgi:aspartate/methionine/tyrosine aminotransferase